MNTPAKPAAYPIDAVVIRGVSPPLDIKQFKVIVFDMDSTLINIECIDELAAVAGKKEEVAAITAASMRGELMDFRASLQQRLALLEGLPTSALQTVLSQRLRLNPGAIELVQYCKQAGLTTALFSGGFTYFALAVQEQLGLDHIRANALEVVNQKLTGKVVMQSWGDIVDGEMKRLSLIELCENQGCTPAQAIAVGDGANDLPMLSVAGLSVAYHAKPIVRKNAHVAINAGGLNQLMPIFRA